MESFLDRLFLNPSLAEDILGLGNWDESALMRIFHPTLQQRLDEALRLAENMERLTRRQPASPEEASRRVTEAMERTVAGYEPEPSCPGEEGSGNWLGCACGTSVASTKSSTGGARSGPGVDGEAAPASSPIGSTSTVPCSITRTEDFYMGSSLVGHRADLKKRFTGLSSLDSRRTDLTGDITFLDSMSSTSGVGNQTTPISRSRPTWTWLTTRTVAGRVLKEPPSIVQAYIDVFGRNPSGGLLEEV